MKQLQIAFVVFLSFVLTSCIPVSGADIVVGNGYHLAEMEVAESIVEDAGFVRVWIEPKGQPRLPRMELADKFEAGFETRNPRGFGVSVVLSRTDGRLVMMFGERNDKLSERGKALLNDLVVRARQRFGDGVTVNPK